MNSIRAIITFNDPFWVGIFERTGSNGYDVAKKNFGAEPTNAEFYHFLLQNVDQLKFSEPKAEEDIILKTPNPKRRQREVQKELKNNNLISKAHSAIKAMQEKNKDERKTNAKLAKHLEKEQKYELKQLQKKSKHRGRG